jgi:cellulose synthase operon protein C
VLGIDRECEDKSDSCKNQGHSGGTVADRRTFRADASEPCYPHLVRTKRIAFRRAMSVALATTLWVAQPGFAQDSGIPESIAPSPAVLEAVSAEYLTSEERSDLRVRHGLYDDLDLASARRRAIVALERGQLRDAVFEEGAAEAPGDGVPASIRVEALARIGNDGAVLRATEAADSLALLALRAASLARLGRGPEALAIAQSPAVRTALVQSTSVEEVLAAVQLGDLRIRLDATAAGEYASLIRALGRARDTIDRLDPRVRLLEARLLFARNKRVEAAAALQETLAFAPRSAEAWYLLGQLALGGFDFVGAGRAAAALRRIDPTHPSAAFLDVQARLLSDDAEGAAEALAPVLARADRPRETLAWRAACEAARYDFAAMQATLAEFEAQVPGSAEALLIAGRQLVFDRQYEEARATLERAALREPAWAAPRAELGLLSMQDGREERALEDLRLATTLDPHDERTLFTLRIAEQLASWNRIEIEHFIIRHPDGDAALVAKLLAGTLDAMHTEICARLQHEPSRKTIIDVMPDHRSFGVRVTGLPRIHTIAVCTGPTIAIEIPKEGAREKHLGLFDPLAVLRHEYTHTVTLSMTRNRIPHWLTEAVAVALEDTPRTFETCGLLAAAWRSGALFNLDEINWAFIRPRKATDRQQAYAQGRWMVEYMEQRFGWDQIRALLNSYAEGITEDEALRRAFSISRAEFFAGFLAWAGEEVRAWGLDPRPSLRELALQLASGDTAAEAVLAAGHAKRLAAVAQAWADAIGAPGSKRFALRSVEWPAPPLPPVQFDDATIRAFLAQHADQADLVEMLLRRAKFDSADELAETRELLEWYARVRPVDPYPHRVWARLATGAGDLASGGDEAAFGHLRELDLRADKDNIYAVAMARNRRAAGDFSAALSAAERAVRMNPFDASVRELAAAVAVEGGQLGIARLHVEALTQLEPDREIHRRRLERVDELLRAAPPVELPDGAEK